MAKRSLSALDDLLIYVGVFMMVVGLMGNACIGLASLAEPAHTVVLKKPDGTSETKTHYLSAADLKKKYPDAVSITRKPEEKSDKTAAAIIIGFLALTFLGGVLFFALGRKLRARERRILAVWQILEHAMEVPMNDIVTTTGFDRLLILETVQFLATRGLGYFVYEPGRDLVLDGRLRTMVIAVEMCPACGAALGLQVSADLSTVPTCTFCGRPISSEVLSTLKMKLLEQLRRAGPPPPPQSQPGMPGLKPQFNVGTFMILFFVFWPAAVFYAVAKSRQ